MIPGRITLAYLLLLLAGLAVAFATVSDGEQVLWRGGPGLGAVFGVGGGGALLMLRRRNIPRVGPGFWPLAALASGRLLSASWSGGWDMALAAATGPIAYLLFTTDRAAIRGTLRLFGIIVAAVQLLLVAGVGYIISINIMAYLLLISAAAWLPTSSRPTAAEWAGLGVVLAAMLSTTSKGVLLGLAAGAAVWWSRPWLALGAAPAGALMWLARPWDTVSWRLHCWGEALRRWMEAPVLGIGPGRMIWDHPMAAHAHNLWLTSLAWDGVTGLGLLAVGSVAAWWDRSRWPRWAAAGIAAMLAHLLVDDFSGCALCVALSAALLATA